MEIQIDPRFDFDSEVEGLSAHVRKIKQASSTLIVIAQALRGCLYNYMHANMHMVATTLVNVVSTRWRLSTHPEIHSLRSITPDVVM